jgi:hypothetical protein
MIPARTVTRSHRLYDFPSSTELQYDFGFGLSTYDRTAAWMPMTSTTVAAAKVAAVPSIGDACAKFLMGTVEVDPKDQSTFSGHSRHFWPDGTGIFRGPTRYPKCVYVYVDFDSDTSKPISNNGFTALLSALYEQLSAVGISLMVGKGPRSYGNATGRSTALIAPVSSATVFQQSWDKQDPPEPIVKFYDATYEAETDPYDAGDLFVAVIQSSWGTGTNLLCGSGLYGTDTNFGGPTRTSSTVVRAPKTSDPTQPVALFGWYTEIETVVFEPANPAVTVCTLAYYLDKVDRELALFNAHAGNYRKLQQKYYYPSARIPTGAGPTGGATFYTTTGEQLYDLIAPPPLVHGSYSTPGNLADQIVADAVTFLS